MKITRLEASNFKSFGNDGTIANFEMSLNTIVGENNVGKSNLIKIIQKIIELLRGQGSKDEDYHNGDPQNTMRLYLEGKLEDSDITILMRSLNIPNILREGFEKLFGNDMNIRCELSRLRGHQIEAKLGIMYIIPNHASMKKIEQGRATMQIFDLANLLITSEKQPEKWHDSVINQFNSASRNNPNVNHIIGLGNIQIFQILANLLSQKVIFFSESRSPTQQSEQKLTSPNIGLANLLYKLKNSGVKDRTRFDQIKSRFSSVFPHLKLDVIEGPQIVLAKSDSFEVNQESVSSGIIEIINILTHLIALEQYTIILDEPELHLHPHAMRTISNIIRESSKNNQIICITHSTSFVYLDNITQIILVRDVKGQSKAIKINDNYFDDEDTKKLLRITNAEQKEFLFSKSVLLVEGDTEFGAMPIFARKCGLHIDENNISVISVDSHFFATFIKMLKGFEIPLIVMCDNDALTRIESHIYINEKKIKTSSIITQLSKLNLLLDYDLKIIEELEKTIIEFNHNGKKEFRYNESSTSKLEEITSKFDWLVILKSDFEGVFQDTKYKEIFDLAIQEFNRNKVLVGRYIAENISDVPEEFQNVIRKLSKFIT